ncbi:asparaginase [Subtercola boreus]|uniref:Asparaginase n=1 Tax=Subtercola boreus TaxID=120213 RepID=A0A3E0WA71_9MICO|nr:asparaginase [Subtercola boreus]RFA20364.1 asparaginase [Subtercola boreus]RFA20518.1 asparaginase [Subtercola boreus]RFA26767.1 asparaginase [Subtercola boreus]
MAVVERSGFVESRHVGSAVVLSPTGEILTTLGDPSAPIIPRSCLKPFQALAVLRELGSGTPLDAVQTVLATASHAGTAEHVAVVLSILQLAGLTPDDLQCPHDWPSSSSARDSLVRAGAEKSRLYMNCSGKHAAMLYACVLNGWPTETYLDPSHPLQQQIAATIEELTGEHITASAVDGCGAPVHAISLVALARGIGRITSALPIAPLLSPVDASADGDAAEVFVAATASQGAPDGSHAPGSSSSDRLVSPEAAALTASVLANGWAIDGPGRANTLCIDELGVFSKLGAEGVMVMSTTAASPAPGREVAPEAAPTTVGTTVALKVLDGNLRAATLVGLTLLVRAGALTRDSVDALLPRLDLTVYGGTAPVGTIRLASALA